MSSLKTVIVWLARLLSPAPSPDLDFDTLTLADWADLPPHHPLG